MTWAGKTMVLGRSDHAVGWDNKDDNNLNSSPYISLKRGDRVLVMNEPDTKTGRFLITVLGEGRMFWAHFTWFDEVKSSESV